MISITNSTPVAKALRQLAEHGLKDVRREPRDSGFFMVVVEDICWGGLYAAYGFGWAEAVSSAAREALRCRKEQKAINILGPKTVLEAIKNSTIN